MSDDLLLGIDGGGTKTVAWIARVDDPGNVLGRGCSGPSNPQVVGADACVAQLDAAIAAAFADTNLTRQEFAAACIGLAGADREADRTNTEHWAARSGLTQRLRVVNDALPVLYAASPDGCGIALIAGTGSFAFGRREDGTTARAGGWGYLFGDEGSAYAIALDGLRAAARSADGRGPATRLLELLLAELGRNRAEELITAVYTPAMTRDRIAALSRLVFDAHRSSDSVATAIIDDAAASLAEMVAAVAVQLRSEEGDWSIFSGGRFGESGREGEKMDRSSISAAKPFPLALAGGVLLNHHELRDGLQTELHMRGLHAGPVVAVPEPVAGALVIAQRAARGNDPPRSPVPLAAQDRRTTPRDEG